MVPKKSGAVCIYVDLTKLNESVEETLGKLAGAKYLENWMQIWGFGKSPLSEDSAKLTTFITPFGRYFFRRLPFEIASTPENFN